MTEQILFEFEVKGGDAAIQEAAHLNRAIQDNRSAIKELSKDYDANAEEIVKLNNENKRLGSEQRNLAKSGDAIAGSYNAMSAEMAELKRRQKDVNTTTAAGKKQFNEYGKRINEVNGKLKKLDEENGVYTRNVGNYKNAITDAAGSLNIMGVNVGQVTRQFSAATSTMQISTMGIGSMSGALKLLKVALIGTGIGALVVGLGSLIAYLSTTQSGIDKMNSVLRPLKALFEGLFGLLQRVGEKVFQRLADALDNPRQAMLDFANLLRDQVINRLQAVAGLARAVVLVFKGEFTEAADLAKESALQLATGVTDLEEKLGSVKQELKDTARASYDLGVSIDAAKKAYELFEIEATTRSAKLRQVFQEQKALSDDANLSLIQRIDASRKAQQALEQLTNIEIKLLQDKLAIRLQEQQLNDTSREDLLENAKLEAQIFNLRATQAKQTNDVKNREITLQQQLNAELIKQLDILKKIDEQEKNSTKTKAEMAGQIVIVKTETERLTDSERRRLEIIQSIQIIAEEAAMSSIQSIQNIGAALGQMVVQGRFDIQQFKKVLVLGLLDTLQGMIPVLVAQITGLSLASPESVATGGIAGLAKAALLTGLLEGAVVGAKAAVNKSLEFEQGGELKDGTIFKGNSHAFGGVKFRLGGRVHEAEGGEAIINKRSTRMFKPVLSAINQAGGGKKFAMGDVLPSNMNQLINSSFNDQQRQSISDGIREFRPVLQVPYTNQIQNGIRVAELNSTL